MTKIKELPTPPQAESSSDEEAEKVLDDLANSDDESPKNADFDADADSDEDFDFNDEDAEMLAKSDPEFHAWMKKQHPNLLEAVEDSEDEAEADEAEAEKKAEMEAFGGMDESGGDFEDETDLADEQPAFEEEGESGGPKSIDETFLENLMKGLEKEGVKNHVRAFNKIVGVLVGAVEFVSQGDEAAKRSKEIQIQ